MSADRKPRSTDALVRPDAIDLGSVWDNAVILSRPSRLSDQSSRKVISHRAMYGVRT
jgi:hypothetical protein